MARGMTYNSFDALSGSGIEFQGTIETLNREDENIVHNRVFVWKFERADLESFVSDFKIYRGRQISAEARQRLNSQLNGKINSMLNEGYIPIECLLYASKVINSKISNDRELITILAERIRDVYLRKTDESIEVFKNILEKWSSWVPQLRIVITAIGLIGDNEELLDEIFMRFVDDEQLRLPTFYAFLQNKNAANLDRAMRVVMGLHENVQIDEQIGRIFKSVFIQFGKLGTKALEKYAGNPGISKLGNKILNKLRNDFESEINVDKTFIDNDSLYGTIAHKSKTDNEAYMDFLAYCSERKDSQAAFFSRFSRPEIVTDFLAEFIRDEQTKPYNAEIGLISLAYLKNNGYADAKDLIREFKDRKDLREGYLIAMVVLQDIDAAQKLVDLLTQEPDHKLGKFFGLMRNASIQSNIRAVSLIQQEIVARLYALLRSNDQQTLKIFTSNLSILRNQRLFYLLSDACLKNITIAISDYSAGMIHLDEDVVIALIDIGQHKYNDTFEGILFDLYRRTVSSKLKNYIFKLLKERDIKAPR